MSIISLYLSNFMYIKKTSHCENFSFVYIEKISCFFSDKSNLRLRRDKYYNKVANQKYLNKNYFKKKFNFILSLLNF